MDLLGLRWTRRGFGSPGRYSIRPNCRLPVGATPNDVFGSRRLDYICGWIRRSLNTALPATVVGGYPESHGWLHIVDVVFGLALVAFRQESVLRRCARHVFPSSL